MRKVNATALRLKGDGHYSKDADIKFSCDNTRWFGVLYLAPSSPAVKKILDLGYNLPLKGKYYVLKER